MVFTGENNITGIIQNLYFLILLS